MRGETSYPQAIHAAGRLAADGKPKRILALDGGGVRGVVTLEFLRKLESELQSGLGRDSEFVLSDFFDLIGGTSVGGLLATLLAMGWRVERIEALFEEWVPQIFKRRRLHLPYWLPMLRAGNLGASIERVLAGEHLGSEKLKTGLCILAKRADTGSNWVFCNNPHNKYWGPRRNDAGVVVRNGNESYLLRDILRAATAAPLYFSPKRISVFAGVNDGLFVDGAVSPHNNPALQLLLTAHVEGYGIGWPLGADKLVIVSIGTGSFAHHVKQRSFAAHQAVDALQGVIGDGQNLALTMLQWMSQSRRPWHIDRALGDMSKHTLGLDQGLGDPLLSFARYDIRLEKDWLAEELGRHRFTEARLHQLRDFTDPRDRKTLAGLAQAAAGKQVSLADIPPPFRY